MSIETRPYQTADAELYLMILQLQGAGAGVIPVIPSTANNHGISLGRTSAGLYTLTFGEEPGPTFQGLDGSFGDANPITVAGWTATGGVYTKRTGGVKATLTFGMQNGALAAADMAVTSYCFLNIAFKLGFPRE